MGSVSCHVFRLTKITDTKTGQAEKRQSPVAKPRPRNTPVVEEIGNQNARENEGRLLSL